MIRPLRVTQALRKVYESVRDNPGIKSKEVVEISKVHHTSVFGMLHALQQLGLVNRVMDTDRKYKCYVTDADVDEVHKQQEILFKEFVAQRDAALVETENEDKLLDSLHTFELTAAQIKFIQSNKEMPRRQLAKKLGISKLELTVGMDKMKNKK